MEQAALSKLEELEGLVKDEGKFVRVSPEKCLELCTSPAYKLARRMFMEKYAG